MGGTATIEELQRYVWELLPTRKLAIDREIANDAIIVAVQCWPVELLSQAAVGSQECVQALNSLVNDIRRMLSCIYGADRFMAYWTVGLRTLIPNAVEIIYDWWRRRKDNRAKIITWRRKWVVE